MALPHTGPIGFEGLIRDSLRELTGQGFRLMKSGPQGGIDSLGEPTDNGLVIGMEGKHYKARTPLGLDELMAKLRDAASTFPSMDLWVLATTRTIDGGDAQALSRVGDELGVEVLIFDWADASAVPPVLAILCGAARNAAQHHLGNVPHAMADLLRLRADPFFSGESKVLRTRLRNASVGLAAARRSVASWLRRNLCDSTPARVMLDSYAAIEAPQANCIARPDIHRALDGWWSNSLPAPGVLLGQEGMGKTWAILSWWLEQIGSQPDFPLTLIVPARNAGDIDGHALLATLLYSATHLRDVGFWRRRLARWLTIESDRPVILLIVDGLNQNWSFTHWSDLILSLSLPEHSGKVAIALTCRPDHWENRLRGLSDIPLAPIRIEVGPFTESELESLLTQNGLRPENLSAQLLALMRVPRLSNIAIARHADLLDVGAVTPERLIYEDWRHRHPGAQRTLSHAEFGSFVAGLGRQASMRINDAQLSRTELLDRLTADNGRQYVDFEGVLSELIDGRWLEATSTPHIFRLDSARVPAALGLALLADTRNAASVEEMDQRSAVLLDPLQGSDLAVAILRHAATFSLIDDTVPQELKRLMIDKWVKSQNFSSIDFESFWRLIACAPDLFIDVAEAQWYGERGTSLSDEALVKGFGNAVRWPNVVVALERRLTLWFSRYWLDPLEGEVLGQITEDENAAKRRRAVKTRADTAHQEEVADRFDISLQEVNPERQAWGSFRAVELLSWLPRLPMVRVFTAWALTRAILGMFRQAEYIAWVLRWNPLDAQETEAALIARADELLAAGSIAREAALAILDALSTPQARGLHDRNFGALPAQPDSGVEWPDPEPGRWQGERPLSAVSSLRADACNPEVELTPSMIERLDALAIRLSDEALLAERNRDDGGLEAALVALARWKPDTLANLIRRRFVAAARAARLPVLPPLIERLRRRIAARLGISIRNVNIPSVATKLPASLLVLRDTDISFWKSISSRAARHKFSLAFPLYAAALANASAREQIDVLSSVPIDPPMPEWTGGLWAPLEATDFETLSTKLDPAGSNETLIFWLHYLASAPIDGRPSAWPALSQLISHSDTGVRTSVFRLIWHCQDAGIADALEKSTWRYQAGMNRDEAAWGSLAMTLAPAAMTGAVASRVHPDALGELSERYPDQAVYCDAFASHVFNEIDFLRTSHSRSYPRALLNEIKGWDQLIAAHGPRLVAEMESLLDPASRGNALRFPITEDFPFLDALEAADRLRPGIKAEAVTRALRDNARSNIRFNTPYDHAATLLGPCGEEARQFVLEEANDDQKLFTFAWNLQKHEQTDWLIEQIQRDLAHWMPGRVARGITLAGFLVPAPEIEKWRTDTLSAATASGWLTEVHEAARKRYRRYCWSQHWLQQFVNAADDDIAFAAFELLVTSVDRRLLLDRSKPSSEEIDALSWRRRLHWRVGLERVNLAAKKHFDALSKTFLCSKPPLGNQAPRRQ